MTQMDRCKLDMLIRIRAFGATDAQLFQATSPAHAAFDAIAAEIDRLEALDVTERSATQAARAARKRAARRLLVDSLARAGATARVLARTNPALDAPVDLPLPSGDLELLTVARHFAATAAAVPEVWAAHGLPVAEVEERIAAFEQALQDRGTGRDARVKTRAEIDASFGRAMDALAILDVTVANCLTTEPVLAVWKHDRRIVYPTRGRRLTPAPNPASSPEPVTEQPPALALATPAASA